MKLEDLISRGLIPANFKLCDNYARINKLCMVQSKASDSRPNGKAIILDKFKWVAAEGELSTSQFVYSCDGVQLGLWDRSQKTFFIKKESDGGLVTVKIEKENKKMDNVNLDNLDVDLTGLTEDIGEAVAAESASMQQMDAFDAVDNDKSTSKPLTESQQRVLNVKEALDQSAVTIADTAELATFNLEHGRLICFICKTDKVIKLSKTQINKLDAQGNAVLKPYEKLTTKERQAVEDNKKDPEKKIPKSAYEKWTHVVFKEMAPSKPIAVVIATPVGGDKSITSIYNEAVVKPDSEKTDLVYKLVDIDTGKAYVLALYNGIIKESENVMGDLAEYLTIDKKVAQPKKNEVGASSKGVRLNFALANKADAKRKTLLTDGNYIPLRRYVTMSQAAAAKAKNPAEAMASLALNVEAAFKKEEAYNALCDDDKKIITDGGKKSKYFTTDKDLITISGVPTFTDKQANVTNIQLPVREKKANKSDPNKFSYGFKYVEFEDFKDDAKIQEILKLVQMTPEAFLTTVKKVTHRSSGNSGRFAITNQEALQSLHTVGMSNYADLSEMSRKLAGVQI